jgi:POT family proton-dependent oligopeptide transporter
MSAIALEASARPHDLLGHPKGLYVCFFTEMWERFSFYGMKALLLLYLTKYHLFGDRAGLDLLGAYGGLVYCIPVIGGVLADRWLGMRKAVVFGGILLVLGHLGMAIEGHAAASTGGTVTRDEGALRVMYLSLALIIVGVGFLKPNISTIVGKLYAPNDARRDSGFSMFYAGINLGALFASLVCGYLGETLGWRYGFGAAGIGMLLGLALFLWGQKYLEGHAEPPEPALLRQRVLGVPRELLIYLGAALGIVPVAWLMWAAANGAFALVGEVSLALGLMVLVMFAVLGWFVWFIGTQCTREQRHQMLSLITLITMALVFFTLYEQTYGSWVTFTDRLLTKDIIPSMVHTPEPPVWSGVWLADIGSFLGHAPWSIYSLLLAPLGFVVAATLSERDPGSGAPRTLFALVTVIMLVFLVRDCVVLPQTAGSLTYLGALFIVLLAPVFSDSGAGWTARPGSLQAEQERVRPAGRGAQLPAAGRGRERGRRHRRHGQRVVAGVRLFPIGGRRDVPLAGRPLRRHAARARARGEPDDGHLVPRDRVLGDARRPVRQDRRDRSAGRRNDEHRRGRREIRRPVLAHDLDRRRLRRARVPDRAVDQARDARREVGARRLRCI